MIRICAGAILAVAMALPWLSLAGRPGLDRVAARQDMAADLQGALQSSHSRAVAVLRPRGVTKTPVTALCRTISRDGAGVLAARLSGTVTHGQMQQDAAGDPVLTWLVALAWDALPDGAGVMPDIAQHRFHARIKQDCARAFRTVTSTAPGATPDLTRL